MNMNYRGVQTGRNIANQFVGEQFNFCLFVRMSSSGSAFFTFHCHFMFHLFIMPPESVLYKQWWG